VSDGQIALFGFAASASVFLLWAALRVLEKINDNIGGLRGQLEQMEERQQRIAADVRSISHHTAPKREGPSAIDELIDKFKDGSAQPPTDASA
jgi:hypothetical protein